MSEPLVGSGCDFWPDGTWKSCCDIHDAAFAKVGGPLDWVNANVDLASCVWQYSHLNAVLMFVGVMLASGFVYKFKSLGGRSVYEHVTGKKY